jgi:CHAT domain-containing protein
MKEFYSGLHRGLRVEQSLREAQLWLRNARAHEIAKWFGEERRRQDHDRVMSYEQASEIWQRCLSLDPEARPFHHPYYWASFFVTGRVDENRTVSS